MVHTSQHRAPSASAKSPVLKLGSVSIDAFLPTENAGSALFFAHKNTSGIARLDASMFLASGSTSDVQRLVCYRWSLAIGLEPA
ncbi:hypothetical protein HETIRDRAFT_102237 [Heterobasidion irregulare TC 32-1]|uniref:Uncharacterized protein n=1 Tax=Heterobasidion irregulare (strain TC 32-1) TaxID=747525 RepID=W4K5Z0_HETIT|nr:uncharacterized protein HETIRDRAFT_102237 [Heterobasidion irregulare TC 32-1]ETW81222.1 hypothetical protein HETIRDRAFT_102237 [Heterobasidion irregulare TC 32-1]